MTIIEHKPFDYFDLVLCINLDHRTDKWNQCYEQFKRLGVADKVERFSAIQNKQDGAIGCRLSHIACAQLAKDRSAKTVLILEDDVDFLEKVFHQTIQIEKDLQQTNWGMCYIGSNWHYLDEPKSKFYKVSDHLFEITIRGVHCTHAYALHESAYDTVINRGNDVKCIDDFYANRILNYNVRVLHSMPMLAIQRESFSDIEQKTLFYDTLETNYQRMINEIR